MGNACEKCQEPSHDADTIAAPVAGQQDDEVLVTAFQHHKLERLFDMTDMDRNGKVDKEDFILWGQGAAACSSTQFTEERKAEWLRAHQVYFAGKDMPKVQFVKHIETFMQDPSHLKTSTAINGTLFDLLDQNKDGEISFEEYYAFVNPLGVKPHHARIGFELIDADGGGTLDRDEFQMACAHYFFDKEESLYMHIFGNFYANLAENPVQPALTIMVVGARGIRNTDWLPGFGKPDCCCEVKRGDHVLHMTKAIKNSIAPCWAEELKIWEFKQGEQLEFTVFNKDASGSSYCGKVTLKPDSYMLQNGCNDEFEMEDIQQNTKACLSLKIKVQGQEDYPKGAPPQIEVELFKGQAKDYGLKFDDQDQKALQIVEVGKGAFKTHNDTVKPSGQVNKSDFIVSVNGFMRSPEMIKQFKQPKVKVTLVRALNTAVVLEKNDTKKNHGIKFPSKKNGTFVVMDIGDGYIKEHNNNCDQESQKIHVSDRIVSVRGQVGNASTINGLLEKATGKFQVGVQRKCPVDAFA